MAKRGYTPEQIINTLREAEILLNQGLRILRTFQQMRIPLFARYRCIYRS
jgi:hypothetical protein